MKLLTCAFLLLFVAANCEEEAKETEKDKRATSSKTAQHPNSDEQAAVAYSTAKVSQQTPLPKSGQQAVAVQYVHQPQVAYVPQSLYKYAQLPASLPAQQVAYPAPTQQQYEQQPVVQYIHQTVTKGSQQQQQDAHGASVAPVKFSYAAVPAPHPIQYSSAADVSSFSYSSPFVTYNNLGLLSQAVGKLASQHVQPVRLSSKTGAQQQQIAYVAAPSPSPVPQQVYYVPSSAKAAANAATAQPQYVFAPQHQQQQPQYSFVLPKSASQSQGPQYTFVPQSVAYAVPQQIQQQYQHQQQVQYEPSPVEEPQEQQQSPRTKEVHQPKANQQTATYTFAPSQYQQQLYSPQVVYTGAHKTSGSGGAAYA